MKALLDVLFVGTWTAVIPGSITDFYYKYKRKRMEEALRAKDDLKEAILVVRRVYKS